MRIRYIAFVLVISMGLVGELSAASSQFDIDVDGYVGEQFGGNDCVDSFQSSYITTTESCNATAAPTFLESKPDPDDDDDIADHAWVKDDSGVYHLYFQTEDQGAGDYLEHYTSTDLQSLSYVGQAVVQNPAGWDSYGLWAPHVVRHNGVYYMFYTGTTGAGGNPATVQRIGVATSTDLNNWTKFPINNCDGATGDGCVYDCNEVYTRVSMGGAYDAQCRDPFVIWDEATSRWLMFTTVNSNVGGPWSQMVAVAQSTDLLNWDGAGYIQASKRLWPEHGGVGLQLSGGVSENPFITEYHGNYYLFFTDNIDPEDPYTVPNPRTMIQYASASSLSVDTSGSLNWTYRGSIPDPGVNAAEILVVEGDTWIMTQSVAPNPNSGDWAAHGRDMRLKRMVWNSDGSFTSSKLSKLSCRVASSTINPGVAEICGDGLDNNCNGEVDDLAMCGACIDADNDGYGTSGFPQCAHPQPDCNDANAAVSPGAIERCDQIDNNCNGQVNEGNVCRVKKRVMEICTEVPEPGGGSCTIYF